MSKNANQRTMSRRHIVFRGLLLLVSTVLVFIALMWPLYRRISALQIRVGEVAPQDIVAPYDLTYISQERSEQQRDLAARAVAPVYTPPDTGIARRQMERLRATLTYITSVRADAYASPQQKESDLAALEDIRLDLKISQRILGLSDARWLAVQQESIVVLEAVMRNTIREDRVDEALRSVPSLVSLSLPEEQAVIVAGLVSGFVAPNSLYSQDLTETAREQARAAVAPVNHSYQAGETIVQRGQVISSTDIEALEHFGLIQPKNPWQELASAASLTLLGAFILVVYFQRDPRLKQNLRGLLVVTILFQVFLFGARLSLSGHAVIPYAYPLAAFSLTVNALFGYRPALIFSLPLAVFVAYGFSSSPALVLFYLMGSFFGVLALGAARRLTSFMVSAVAVAVSGSMVIIAFRLTESAMDWVGMTTLVGASMLNGVASAVLTVLLQLVLAQFLGMTTALQLVEISRPDHPLLQLILRNAPGTYQHSLQVANLAEQAAERIGADALLTRVGALYHDAGKTVDAFFFIENQLPESLNPHHDMEPAVSAAAIIRHVPAGLELARKYRLPQRIQDFITEHHGTMLTRYQYIKAVEAAGGDESQIDKELFRYPGPLPRSRETAILMLADGSEARVRAERPQDEAAMRSLIKSVIENRLSAGQLDNTDLTLRDLDELADSFTATLRGIYHPRIEYPKLSTPPR